MVTDEGLAAAARAHDLAARTARTRPLYGRSTGVGANRDTSAIGPEAGVRLLRSHASGIGPALPSTVVRCALGIRANQLLAGGSGATPDLAVALVGLASGPEGELPVIHAHGGLGTGDLTALAEVALTLAGERARADGSRRQTFRLASEDALPLLSSNAFSLARAGLGGLALGELSRAAIPVSALSWVALRGSPEAVGPAVRHATPFPGAIRTAELVSGLVGEQDYRPGHIQDFFGLRAWPQAHGPLLDELRRLREVVETMVNAPAENPLFVEGTASHQGGFHASYLSLASDAVLLALVRSAEAVASRAAHLLAGEVDGLPRFLAGLEAGASGLLIGEYVTGAALARLRAAAGSPASVLSATASLGIEDLASLAPLATARLQPAADDQAELLAVELVCAVRALRLHGEALGGALAELFELCASLPSDTRDRDLADDLAAARRTLSSLAQRVDGCR